VTEAPIEPVFIDGTAGRLFAVFHPPAGVPRGRIVYLPPFAEEMNCSRRMAALTARALAACGFGVLVLDPFGSGDSAGDFADARWAIWRRDVGLAAAWLGARVAGPLTLLGLRLGAMLAAAAEAERLVLWQPVASGATMLTRFLRLRVAATMDGADRETTAALRALLAAGEAIEVGGYPLHPALAAELEGLRLTALDPDCPVTWFEVASTADGETRPLSPGAARVVADWRQTGRSVDARVVAGEPFWQIQETTLAPALITATVAALSREG